MVLGRKGKNILKKRKNSSKMYILGFAIRVKDLWREKPLKKILEVRWHGRGGQGAWTASELLARAAIAEGKFIQSFPEFGPERMGAPVTAFTRISTEPIMIHCAVYSPDVVAVLDPTLLKTVNVAEGLNERSGNILVNTKESPGEIRKLLKSDAGKVWTVEASEISLRILGMPITNTAMLGAVARVTGIVSLETLEKMIDERFRSDVAAKNFAVVKEAYQGVISE
jgi:2-oxoacid:acceptor oxidoreductase gamma subunit (pyruvate/2-ketoisovalerate family)